MGKIKTKVIASEIGKYNVDSITVKLNGKITSICFDKSHNVTRHNGNYVFLINKDGIYSVEPYSQITKE